MVCCKKVSEFTSLPRSSSKFYRWWDQVCWGRWWMQTPSSNWNLRVNTGPAVQPIQRCRAPSLVQYLAKRRRKGLNANLRNVNEHDLNNALWIPNVCTQLCHKTRRLEKYQLTQWASLSTLVFADRVGRMREGDIYSQMFVCPQGKEREEEVCTGWA